MLYQFLKNNLKLGLATLFFGLLALFAVDLKEIWTVAYLVSFAICVAGFLALHERLVSWRNRPYDWQQS